MANKNNGTVENALASVEMLNGNLVIQRKPINDKNGKQRLTDDGRKWFAYMIPCKLFGRETQIDFEPRDKGGYELLDILFDLSPKAELIMAEATMTDDNGRTSEYMTYTARVYEPKSGKPIVCSIKLSRNSDKDILRNLLSMLDVASDTGENT